MRVLTPAVLVVVGLVVLLVWWSAGDSASERAVATVSGSERSVAQGPAASPMPDERGQRSPVSDAVEMPDKPGAGAVLTDAVKSRLLRGRLVELGTNLPIPDRLLCLHARFRRGAERVEVKTDHEGRFEVVLETGEYVIGHQPIERVDGIEATFELDPTSFDLAPAPALDRSKALILTFHAQLPPFVLEVDVVYEGGHPAVGAFVCLEWEFGDYLPSFDLSARTDARGRARLGVWRPDAPPGSYVRAWDEAGLVSENLTVETPFEPWVRRLVLGPGGEVDVRVLTADGQPVHGSKIMLVSPVIRGPGARKDTDKDGRAVLRDLVPGPYRLHATDRTTDIERQASLDVLVRRGERERLELLLEPSGIRLAASGRVIDEQGRPLPGVWFIVTPVGELPLELITDSDGQFKFWWSLSEGLWIETNLSPDQDRFEPSRLWVRFGTKDVEVRRVEQARTVRFEIEVVDRATGEEIAGCIIATDRGPGTEENANSYGPRRTFEIPILEDSRLRIAARGYLARTRNLSAALDQLEGSERLHVELDRGLHHELRVLDGASETPLPGVIFSSPTAGEARTDSEGQVILASDHWSVYEVSKPGYATESWDPDDGALWGWRTLHLYPVDDRED